MKDKVEIVYITQDFVSKFGAEPIEVPPSLAQKYETMGVAKIVVRKPVGNVLIEKEHVEEKGELYIPEREYLTKVAWVSGKSIKDSRLSIVGDLVGFDIKEYNAETFIPGKLIKTDMVVVSSNLSGFDDNQKLQLKSMLFQRRIPFVYYVENDYEDFLWEKFCLIRSTLNVFLIKRVMERATDNYGDTIGQSFFYDGVDPFRLWKVIDSVIK